MKKNVSYLLERFCDHQILTLFDCFSFAGEIQTSKQNPLESSVKSFLCSYMYKWICGNQREKRMHVHIYRWIHRVVQIDELLITIILFSNVRYLCIMIRLIIYKPFLNSRELTFYFILWHHRISKYMHRDWITISEEFYHIKLLINIIEINSLF